MTSTVTRDGFSLSAQTGQVGDDLCVLVTGGKAHIGSVSMAMPYPEKESSGTGHAAASTFCRPGHRDDVVSDRFAKTLAARLQQNVTVLCGIHYDNAGPQDIGTLLALADELLEILCAGHGADR